MKTNFPRKILPQISEYRPFRRMLVGYRNTLSSQNIWTLLLTSLVCTWCYSLASLKAYMFDCQRCVCFILGFFKVTQRDRCDLIIESVEASRRAICSKACTAMEGCHGYWYSSSLSQCHYSAAIAGYASNHCIDGGFEYWGKFRG